VSTYLSEGLGLVAEDGRREQSWEQEAREHKREWRQPGKSYWESEDSEEESNKTIHGDRNEARYSSPATKRDGQLGRGGAQLGRGGAQLGRGEVQLGRGGVSGHKTRRGRGR
jgi:hypothetical protein